MTTLLVAIMLPIAVVATRSVLDRRPRLSVDRDGVTEGGAGVRLRRRDVERLEYRRRHVSSPPISTGSSPTRTTRICSPESRPGAAMRGLLTSTAA